MQHVGQSVQRELEAIKDDIKDGKVRVSPMISPTNVKIRFAKRCLKKTVSRYLLPH